MPSRKFCYICGRQTDELHEGMCSSCFLKEKEFVTLPERIEVDICRGCGRYRGGIWDDSKSREELLESVAQVEVERNLNHRVDEIGVAVTILKIDDRGKSLSADLQVEVSFTTSTGLEHATVLSTTLELRWVLCPVCSKRSGGYYEAVVQLRSADVEGVYREACDMVNRLYEKDQMAFVVGESRVNGGVDIKLGSAKVAAALSSHFKTHHGAHIKKSVTLVGRKNGKDVYRKTILIRV